MKYFRCHGKNRALNNFIEENFENSIIESQRNQHWPQSPPQRSQSNSMAGLIPPDPRLKTWADANKALESHTASFLQEPVAPPDAGPNVCFATWLCAVSHTWRVKACYAG